MKHTNQFIEDLKKSTASKEQFDLIAGLIFLKGKLIVGKGKLDFSDLHTVSTFSRIVSIAMDATGTHPKKLESIVDMAISAMEKDFAEMKSEADDDTEIVVSPEVRDYLANLTAGARRH